MCIYVLYKHELHHIGPIYTKYYFLNREYGDQEKL